VRTVRRVPELGIDFIDTADSYGAFVSEELLAEVLAPYPRGMVIATKGGFVRHGPDVWLPVGRPEYLKQCVLMSLRRLKQDQLDLWQLTASTRRFRGTSSSTQWRRSLYNLVNRHSEAVLDQCEKEGIGFIPWFPLAAGALAAPGGVVDEIARRHGVSRSAVAIAWLLRRSSVMLPIPGTATVEHLKENVAGATVQLSDDEFRTLDARGKEAWKAEQG